MIDMRDDEYGMAMPASAVVTLTVRRGFAVFGVE
jgi:hypothetical protein